jgi:3-hydroxy-9,10-secoandrosta-1,3,5(10)-triene-9,17-dione monooxygenase
MLFIAPESEWEMLNDWGTSLGLKGSGSHSITIDGARIPDHLTLPTHHSQVTVTGGTPGLDLHGNPEYGGGQLSSMVLEGAALAVGMAQGALDAYGELMRTRTTLFPPIVGRTEDPDYQYWYGEAAGLVATADAAFAAAVQQWRDACAQGSATFTRECELRIAAISREVVRLSWQAVERYLFPTAGSSSVRQGERIERVWRDMSTLHTHAGFAVFLSGPAKRELTKAHFATD